MGRTILGASPGSWANSLLKSLQWCLVAFFLVACGGGGCGGCESCGVAPIPGGFPIEERIENAAQVRLTSSGIDFIESNADSLVGLFLDGGLDFPIPPINECVQEVFGACVLRVRLCEDGSCVAHAEIDSLTIQPAPANELRVNIRVILDSRDTAGNRSPWRGTCDVDVNTREGSREYVGLNAVIAFVEETEVARAGYTKLEVRSVGLAGGEGLEDDDFSLGGGTLCGFADSLGFLKDIVVDQLESQVGGLLQDTLDEQLCTTRGEYGCPNGTFAVPDESPGSTCRYADSASAACVPMLLGTDGQGDLGAAFLGGISPGTHAPGQFLLASGGDGEAVNDGMSLFMYGGFIGTNGDFTVTPAHNPCVPVIDPPPLPTIPRVDTFRSNSVPGLATDPHVSIGLAESFLDHAGYGMFDSGLLCIGAGTNLAQELSTGLFSIFVSSLDRLVFPEDASPLGISLRPQTPPDFTIGAGSAEDPLLQIALDQMQMDFYVWSQERYIRFMTYEADLRIGINLRAEAGELIPEIVELAPVDGTARVFNTEELLREDPASLADSMSLVLETAIGMFAGGLGGFALPEIEGLQLEVPEGGIQGIEDGGESFLGIFANLAPPTSPLTTKVDTSMSIIDAEIDPTALELETLDQGRRPRVTLQVQGIDGPAGADLEYSVRVDGMPWSRWTSDTEIVLDDEVALLFQAKHTIEARARVVGEPLTVDESPAFQQLIIDVLAPRAEIEQTAEGTQLFAWDVVTPNEDLQIRHRPIGGDAWSEWIRFGDMGPLPVGELEVEVKDEAGNVGSTSSALIRGTPNPNGSGCECSVDGRGDPKAPTVALLLLVLFVIARRRKAPLALREAPRKEGRGRRGRTFLFLNLVLPFALAIGGCDCGGEGDDTVIEDNPPTDDGGTNMDGGPPGAALEPGLLATHLDMAAQADGTLVLAGYSPGNPPRTRYGDLVVGVWDSGAETVSWEIVDGAPDGPVTNEPGWRDGVSAAGDDVGRWASIISVDGDVHVAYYDKTNGALKLASGIPGGSWAVHTVDDEGDAGRYASLIATPSGVAVSYLVTNVATATPGKPTSAIKVATASGVPGGATDWTITEVYSAEIPCRFALCPEGVACVEDGTCQMEGTGCDCASDEACIEGSCRATFTDDWVEAYPEAVGLYTSLANTSAGLGVVWYDRTAGNIWGSAFDGSTWGTPFLIDGYEVGEAFIGDSGVGASLAVDSADVWHVTYVDGAEETLRYARIEGGTVTTEVVDNGTTDGTTMHDDGRHLVGDDSSIVVTDGGEVRVAYQDATAGRAMFARRGGDGTWTLSVVDEDDVTGFFTSQVVIGTTSYVATWWRNDSSDNRGNGVRVVSID